MKGGQNETEERTGKEKHGYNPATKALITLAFIPI